MGDTAQAALVRTSPCPRLPSSTSPAQSIPVCMLLKDGKKVDQVVGAVPKPALFGMVRKHVGAAE